MRTVDGHFTIVNDPGNARQLAANLLEMFESVREPEHIIVTEALLEQGALRAQSVLSHSLEHSIKKLDAQIAQIDLPSDKVTFLNVDKAQIEVLDATRLAEKNSSNRNWRKLDKARKRLAKELNKAGFASYTAYADFINAQGIGGEQRRELLIARDELVAKKKLVDNSNASLKNLTPAQIITVLADVLSRCPRTPVGPLPIIVDDALRSLDVSTKLRALEVLKAHASHYATWYVTDDPLVLGWAGFEHPNRDADNSTSQIYDVDVDVA